MALVLCKYSKFQIKSNSYFSIRFEIIWNFRILTITNFLFNRMTLIFHLTNHT